ncbi:MAG: hypothetical protein WCD89_07755 [Anaerocolumna sp.]
MDVLEPYRVLPFPTDCYMLYKGIAFDGCFFYLTMPKNCRIYKFDPDFRQEGIIETNKPYSCICYDNTENCFWASADKINTMIFKLDCNMKEIDLLQLGTFSIFCSNIKSLSYNCKNNSLFVAYKDFIAEILKDGESICLQETQRGYCNAILSIAPYYMISTHFGNSQCISIYTGDGCLIKSFQFSNIYKIEDILFYPCNKKDKNILSIYILATKHCCYPRLLLCKLEGCGMVLCSCNYKNCSYCRHKSREQCSNDLLESIALEETALSLILNELGEKLQKSIQISENVCDLLEVNKAVNKTIINITQLEHILYAKLETLSSINNDICCEDTEYNKQK